MNCSYELTPHLMPECSPPVDNNHYLFIGRSLYKNGIYYGEIICINEDQDMVEVQYRGDNKYMIGQTITVMISNHNA